MYAGYDSIQGFQLYASDPSGNYAAWRANATGKNMANARSTLKEDYNEDCSLGEALILAAKILSKSMDAHKPDASRFEISVVQKNANGEVVQRAIEGQELQKILEDAKVYEDEEQKN